MTRYVVDASVVLKWYFQEMASAEAARLATSDFEIHVPDILFAQVGNVLWRRVRHGELKREDGHRILSNLRRLPLVVAPSTELSPAALEIASATTRTYNESIYFALAIREGTQLVTADRWWYSLLSTGSMRRLTRWVGDVPAPPGNPENIDPATQ